LLPDGGYVQSQATSAADTVTRNQIRNLLREEAKKLAGGFGVVDSVDLRAPAGLMQMRRLRSLISVRYEEVERGARIRFTSKDPSAVTAIHDFLQYEQGKRNASIAHLVPHAPNVLAPHHPGLLPHAPQVLNIFFDELDVLTQHNDNYRTGRSIETQLTPQTVSAGRFGRLWSFVVNGEVYAQPLYVHKLGFAGTPHNVLYVATERNTTYAFDADRPGAPLWMRQLEPSVSVDRLEADLHQNYHDMDDDVGITSTPVIDRKRGLIYVVTKSLEDNVYHYRMHALSLTTGLEDDHRPAVEIQATITKTKIENGQSRSRQITFNPLTQLNRPALTLASDLVLVAFASHGDFDVGDEHYHGWIFAHDAETLAIKSVFVTTFGEHAGIWQAGQGLAVDDESNVYAITGNGSVDDDATNADLGESFLKFSTNGGALALAGRFTAGNHSYLNSTDQDLGSAGPLLIPASSLMLGGGKEGMIYILDRNLQLLQKQQAVLPPYRVDAWPCAAGMSPGYCRHIHGSPVLWDEGSTFYVWGENDHPRSFHINRVFSLNPVSEGLVATRNAPLNSMPGGILSISAPADVPNGAVVWATVPFRGDANLGPVPGELVAFDALTMQELWASRGPGSQNFLGTFAKFCPPTIANGRVYVATFDNAVAVYGLR